MYEQSKNNRSSIEQLMIWSVATPVLSTWALLSLLPIVSVIRAWGDVTGVFIALAFLGTGAFGLAAAALGYRFLLGPAAPTSIASPKGRTRRAIWLTLYAVIWTTLYAVV